jgi:hypothetical protein
MLLSQRQFISPLSLTGGSSESSERTAGDIQRMPERYANVLDILMVVAMFALLIVEAIDGRGLSLS